MFMSSDMWLNLNSNNLIQLACSVAFKNIVDSQINQQSHFSH